MIAIIGIPTFNGSISQFTFTSIIRASQNPLLVGGFTIETSSLLTWNLNKILARALNDREKGVTHLCIFHNDIELEAFWLDKMLRIMEEKKADIVSVTMPIKNDKGHSSTALYDADQLQIPARTVKRLTLKQCADMGGTFTTENLLVNTGVMLMDISKEWIDGLHFTMEDCIVKDKDGKLQAHVFSEDWDFSFRARERGASIWATNAIKAFHHGGGRWSNQIIEVK